MKRLDLLKEEIASVPLKGKPVTQYLMYLGYSGHFDDEVPIARAFVIESLFTRHEPFLYKNDLIAGSLRGRMSDNPELSDATLARAAGLVSSYGSNHFWTNADHFAPDYKTFLEDGVGGTLEKIEKSKGIHRHDPYAKKKLIFLRAAEIAMRAFGRMILRYGEAAEAMAAQSTMQKDKENFFEMPAYAASFQLLSQKHSVKRFSLSGLPTSRLYTKAGMQWRSGSLTSICIHSTGVIYSPAG